MRWKIDESFLVIGYMGECGLRGAYCELINLDPEVKAMHLKCISAMLCPTVLGQVSCPLPTCKKILKIGWY